MHALFIIFGLGGVCVCVCVGGGGSITYAIIFLTQTQELNSRKYLLDFFLPMDPLAGFFWKF